MGFAKATDPAADPAKYLNRSEDVHMGYDPAAKKGGDMNCVACHQVKKDAVRQHGRPRHRRLHVPLGGRGRDEGLHGLPRRGHQHPRRHVGRDLVPDARPPCLPGLPHPDVRAQGRDLRRLEVVAGGPRRATGRRAPRRRPALARTAPAAGTYSKKKGCFTWATNVRPTLRYYDGKWNRIIVGFNNKYTTTPVDLGSPSATYKDPAAKIYRSRR